MGSEPRRPGPKVALDVSPGVFLPRSASGCRLGRGVCGRHGSFRAPRPRAGLMFAAHLLLGRPCFRLGPALRVSRGPRLSPRSSWMRPSELRDPRSSQASQVMAVGGEIWGDVIVSTRNVIYCFSCFQVNNLCRLVHSRCCASISTNLERFCNVHGTLSPLSSTPLPRHSLVCLLSVCLSVLGS